MTRLEEMVRNYIRDLIFPMQPSEEAVIKTVREVTEIMKPWMAVYNPPSTQDK